MRILIALFAIAFVTQSQAIELTFKFQAHSSGPDMYACNAGMTHPNPGDQVCYIDNTTTPCDPSACAGGKACDQNCLCTGIRGGSYRMDFMKANYGAWDGPSTPKSLNVQSNPDKFNQLFTDKEAWEKRIDNLNFMLGSERYGAEYFVDICYRGPQINYDVNAPHSFFAQTTAQDFSLNSGISYLGLSGIVSRIEYTCDMQKEGDYQFWDTENNPDSIENEAVFGGGDRSDTSIAAAILGNTIEMGTFFLNRDSHAPKFCKVRYYYKESKTQGARGWKYHGGKFCTHTRIEEADSL